MTELTTSQLIKIIIGIFVVVVVVLGIFLFFKNTVIDFFKNLPGDDETEKGGFGGAGASGSLGSEGSGEIKKTYKIDRVGFKIGNNLEFTKDVLKTGAVEFIVISEDNCEKVEYQIWKDKLFDSRVGNKGTSLEKVNMLLNEFTKGKYHVDSFCFDNKGKSTKIVSKNLEIR